MKITINKRNKIILYVLLGILIFLGYYQLVLKNQRTSIVNLQNELSLYDDKINSFNTKKEYEKQLDSEIEVYTTAINEKVVDFSPEVIQEKIIVILDSLVSSSSLTCSSMSFTPSSIEQLSQEESTTVEETFTLKKLVEEYNKLIKTESISDENENSISDETLNGSSSSDSQVDSASGNTESTDGLQAEVAFEIEKMNVSLQLSGTYSQLSNFVSLVKSHEHKIIINNLTILAGEGDILTADLNVDFYSVPKLIFEDGDYLNWNYDNSYGKENPFQ